MPENAIEKVLKIYFSKSTRSDWEKVAMRETQGKNPFEILSWRGKDGILFLPYYDTDNVADRNNHSYTAHTSALPASVPARTWVNLPAVVAPDTKTANAIALEHLTCGADGIFFDLQNIQATDPEALLRDIEWPYCTVAFMLNDNGMFPNALSDFIARKFDPTSVTGALFWESVPKRSNFDFLINHCKRFYALGLHVPPTTPAAEISYALLEGVKIIDEFETRSDGRDVLRSICFSMEADASIVETVAKLKALRILWKQIALSYGYSDYKLEDLYIHTRTALVGDGTYAPHENMLHGSFAAIAAVLGGCNGLTVMAEHQPPFVVRWARNVSAVVREEAFLDKVSDPLAGSYAVDCIVDEIATKAWEMFQVKWKAYETTS